MIQEYIGFKIPVSSELPEVNSEKRNESIKLLKSKPKRKR